MHQDLHKEPMRSQGGPTGVVRSANLLIAELIQSDFELINPHLRVLELSRNQMLAVAGDDLNLAYFPHGGIISLMVRLIQGQATEVAMIGRQSAFGLAGALGNRTASTTAQVQMAGICSTLPIARLEEAADRSKTLRATLFQHEQAIFIQAQQTAVCNISHPTVARLTRWLLRARDTAGSDDLQFSQEFLGQLLGVHRNAVSVVASVLREKGLIQFSRAHIRILDVDGLQGVACECYETVRDGLERMKGGPDN